jgi:hypothetical protein
MRWTRAVDEQHQRGWRSRVVLTPRRWRQVSRKQFHEAPVANEPGHRGEHEVTVKTIAQGRPGFSGEPVVTTLVCFFISHARLRVQRAPGFPCALVSAKFARMCERAVLTNRPLLELSPLRPKAREPVAERGTAPVSSSTRTVARASSPYRARKGVDDGTK